MQIPDSEMIDEGPDLFAALTPRIGTLLFIVIMSGQAAQSIVFGLIGPMLPAMSRAFGPTNGTTDVQLLLALPSLGILVAGVMSGWMIERWGLRRVLLVALVTYGIAGSVPAFTGNIAGILVSRLILGIACVIFSTSCSLLLVLRYRGDSRSRAMGERGPRYSSRQELAWWPRPTRPRS